jgi:MSHA biogenesis protein MshL
MNATLLRPLPAGTVVPRLCMLALAASLAACQTGPKAGSTQSAIGTELQQARADRPAPGVPPSVAQALLPPVRGDRLLDAAVPEQRFDLAVTNASAAQVFQAIGSGSRYSVLLSPNVTGTVTVNLKEVTVREALEVMRELYGFEYRIDGNRVYVQPAALQTRMFQVAYPSARRVGRSETRVVSGSISSSSQTQGASGSSGGDNAAPEGSQVSTTSDVAFWTELDASLKAVVGTEAGRQVVLSQHSGVIVVRAFPSELREVENFLRASKLSIERQVMLEAKIVEVSLRDGFESGINWAAFTNAGDHRWSLGANADRLNMPGSIGRRYGIPTGSVSTGVDPSTTPVTVTPSTLGQLIAAPLTGSANALGLAFTSNSFASLLSFLETQGSVHVLSSPRVAAINNQKAVLRVGTDDFFITAISTTTTTSAAGNVTTPTITTQPFFSGISLDVTPQIDEEGMVTLHIRPSVSTVSERTKVVNLGTLGSFTLPLASSNINETDTIVRVQDGVTVAIGGLMQQTQSEDDTRVPFAGDAPVIGNLFKRANRSLQKRELVFLLRPTVIKGDSQWQSDLAGTERRLGEFEAGPRERLPLPPLAGPRTE